VHAHASRARAEVASEEQTDSAAAAVDDAGGADAGVDTENGTGADAISDAMQTAWETDMGIAWDAIAALFLERTCEAGMKVRYVPWTDQGQCGRELTVYVFTHSAEYDAEHRGGPMAGLSPAGQEHLHHLGFEHEAAFGGAFWKSFVLEAEARLTRAGLVPGGVADGDLPLPGCRYVCTACAIEQPGVACAAVEMSVVTT
jgi:hypothetical protein